MLFWNNDGTVKRRELYRVGRNPIESGRDQAPQRPERADELQELLQSYLESVNASKPKPREKPKRRQAVTRLRTNVRLMRLRDSFSIDVAWESVVVPGCPNCDPLGLVQAVERAAWT